MSLEYRRLDPSGRMIWVLGTAFLIRQDPPGDVRAFIYLKDIDGQKRAQLELVRKAERDTLTGLYNRPAALSLIGRHLAEQPDAVHALLMLDIDNFKSVNDTYGHLYGDAVLSEIGRKLQRIFRRDDVLGRLGGDEFLVFLRDLPEEGIALVKADMLCKQMHTVFSSGDRECEISCSVGVAFVPRHGLDFDTLYDHADAALYHAKRSGRNRFTVYRDGLTKIDPTLRTPPRPERERVGKPFSDNITEYVFQILYNAQDLERAVTAVLELMCKHFHVQHSYLFEYAPGRRRYSMTFEWCDADVPSVRERMQELAEETFGEYWKRFAEDGTYCVEDLSHERVPAQCGARATFQCAIVLEGEFWGFIGVDDFFRTRRATAQERDTIKSISGLIGLFLSRHRALHPETAPGFREDCARGR